MTVSLLVGFLSTCTEMCGELLGVLLPTLPGPSMPLSANLVATMFYNNNLVFLSHHSAMLPYSPSPSDHMAHVLRVCTYPIRSDKYSGLHHAHNALPMILVTVPSYKSFTTNCILPVNASCVLSYHTEHGHAKVYGHMQ